VFGRDTYLIFELAWAVPVVLLQWAVGYRALWRHRVVLALACLAPTLYLCAADDWAIHSGIWLINPARTVGWSLLGLPLEEAIFFLLTNAMVVQTVVLVRGAGAAELAGGLRRLRGRP
jgi:lycopene cyclase domain-containing protein